MGQAIIRATRDRDDLYLVWSSIVDAPVGVGEWAVVLAGAERDLVAAA